MVNLQVCLMSHLHLRRVRAAPLSCRFRDRPLCPAQQLVLQGLFDDCLMTIRAPHKMGSRGAAMLDSTFEYGLHVASTDLGGIAAPPPGMQSSPFVASRAKFLKTEIAGFDPVPWLPVLEGATYIEPRLLVTGTEESDLPLARFGATKSEGAKFAKLIDDAGRLYLARPHEAAAADRMNVMSVYKDKDWDRTVWDRRRRNFRETHLKGAGSSMPGGYELCELEVPAGQFAHLFVDDLADMYPTFSAPPERAITNAMALELDASDCVGYKAYKRFHSEMKRKVDNAGAALGLPAADAPSLPSKLVPCCASLVMGDLNAVDYACAAHENILESGGALPDHERLRHGRPAPRDNRLHALVIDDHVGLVAGASTSSAAVEAMRKQFELGTQACAQAGLPQHANKKVRAERDGVALGAELVGGTCLGAERVRRIFLAVISLTLTRKGLATGAMLRRLLASWTYCALFRRPFMCLLGQSFKQLPRLECHQRGPSAARLDETPHYLDEEYEHDEDPMPRRRTGKEKAADRRAARCATSTITDDHEVYSMPKETREDLLMLSIAAPFMFTHLRAEQSARLICTDASTEKLGAVEAPVDPRLHGELWRQRNRRGWVGHLVSAEAEYIFARGAERVSADLGETLLDQWDSERQAALGGVQRQLVETFDYLEVCCGRNSVMVDACMQRKLRCGPRIDLLLHVSWDIRSGRIVEWILFLVHNKRVFHIHVGAPCTTFSIARHPKERSREHPLGKYPKSQKILDGNLMLLRTMLILFSIYLSGNATGERYTRGSHEHPASAFSWAIPSIQKLFSHTGCGLVNISFCQFGVPYRKNTTLGYIFADYVKRFEGRTCKGGHKHIALEGSLTSRASEYPRQFCEEYSEHIAHARSLAESPATEDGGHYRAGALERLYFNEILESAPWKVLLKTGCGERRGRRDHINILEVRSLLRTIAREGTRGFEQRQIYGLDSQVGLGALIKGRSPSEHINNELRQGLPGIVCMRHYPGYFFAPTRYNPGDCPTRDHDIPPPRGMPEYLLEAAEGRFEQFDRWAAVALQTRSCSTWARFTLRLLYPVRTIQWPW